MHKSKLYDMAGEIAMDKLMPKPIEITISMRGGGGLSDLNDSININGQPHRLVWANPKEERVLKDMGGSGKEVLGKPAYFDEWSMGGDIAEVEMAEAFADPNYEYIEPETRPYDPVPVSDAEQADLYIDRERYAYPRAVPAGAGAYDLTPEAKAAIPPSRTYPYRSNITTDQLEREIDRGRGLPYIGDQWYKPTGSLTTTNEMIREIMKRDKVSPQEARHRLTIAQPHLGLLESAVPGPDFFSNRNAQLGLSGISTTTDDKQETAEDEEEIAEQDNSAKINFMNTHLALHPGGRYDHKEGRHIRADEDFDIIVAAGGSPVLDTIRGQTDVYGAISKFFRGGGQERLQEEVTKEIELTPEGEQGVDNEKYTRGVIDSTLLKEIEAQKRKDYVPRFGLTEIVKASTKDRGDTKSNWEKLIETVTTPTAVHIVNALKSGIPDAFNIWGTATTTSGEGVYITKDGKIIPFTSDTERGNIESGSLRGENVVPKKLKRRPIQVASAEEVEEEPSPLQTLLDARSEVSPLERERAKMEERVNRYYRTPEDPTRNIFSELA